MAVWGDIVGGKGRIGISITETSETNTQVKWTVKVWFWSKYGVSDSGNTLYYNAGTYPATTSVGSVNIHTTVSSGSGWSTSNQKCILTRTYTYNKGTSSVQKWFSAKLKNIDAVGGTMSVAAYSYIPALAKYTVSFNANGGSGAPSSKTKYYGKTLTLPTTKPTRTGYKFQGWGTTSTDTTVNYNPGGSYTANASDTLYAIWKANTYSVTFDANGGTGAPSAQTKTYGQTLTLSSTVPTRQNYNFLGWATDPLATEDEIAYSPGSSYTTNAALKLYAVWKIAQIPSMLNSFDMDRSDSSGTLDDEGTYSRMDLALSLSSDTDYISATVSYRQVGADNYTTASTVTKDAAQIAAWGKTNIVASDIFGTDVFGGGNLSTEYSWELKLDIVEYKNHGTEDESQMTIQRTIVLPAMKFIIDFHAGGDGLAVGKPATGSGFDIGLDTTIQNGNTVGFTNSEGDRSEFLKAQSSGRPIVTNHIGLANGMWLQGQLASGSFSNILRINTNGQVELNWNSGGLYGRVIKTLWSGTWTPNGTSTITVPESDYYSMFIMRFSGRDTRILLIRNLGRTGGVVTGIGAFTSGSAGSFTRYAVRIAIDGNVWKEFRSVAAYDNGEAFVSSGNSATLIQGVL